MPTKAEVFKRAAPVLVRILRDIEARQAVGLALPPSGEGESCVTASNPVKEPRSTAGAA